MNSIPIEIIDSGLSSSDWIQIFATVASLIISIISTIIAVVAVRQTKSAAEKSTADLFESLRGNIGISYDMIQHSKSNPVGYFIVKNYGSSSLRFTRFEYDEKILENSTSQNKEAFKTQFDRMKDITLAPGQAVRIMFIEENISDHDYCFSFSYVTNGRDYSDEIRINVAAITGILKGKRLARDPAESEAVILAEIAERMM